MLRNCYRLLLRLHPAPFRQRFGREMLAIFDEIATQQSPRGLLIDAGFSLFRQWVLRPEFRDGEVIAPIPADAPGFTSFEGYKIRPAAVLYGSLLSIALFWAVIFAIDHPGKTQRWAIGAYRTAAALIPFTGASADGAGLQTAVSLGEPENPWHAIASAYFKTMPVLQTLDKDQDFVISPAEIAAAPAMLPRLDRNNDGKLNPEECGLFLGVGPHQDPAFLNRVRLSFMKFHPVLAVLDVDHNAEISAVEIANSVQSLRRLDTNGDGSLSPAEVMPNQTYGQVASIIGLLDQNHDGRISSAEGGREESAALREILMTADRNHDGFTTVSELTEELLIREGAGREPAVAPKLTSTGR